jgi:hypothetical protein
MQQTKKLREKANIMALNVKKKKIKLWRKMKDSNKKSEIKERGFRCSRSKRSQK